MRLLTTFLLLLISCGTVPPTNDLLGAWIGVESWNESFVGLVLDFKNDTEVTMANTITKEERKFKYKFNSVDNKLLLEHNGNYELFGNIKRLTSDGFGIKNPDSSYTTFSRIQEIKIESTKNEIVNALKNSSWVSKNEKHSLRIDFMDNHRWDSEKQPYVAMFHHGDSAIEKRYETWDIGEYSGKLFLNYSNDQSFYIANQITEYINVVANWVGSIDSDEQADKISVDKKKCKATVEFLQNQSFMKITLVTLTLILGLLTFAKGQANTDKPSTTSTWTDADRKYLLDNLIRSKEEIIAETKSLTKEQWNFKESPDRWSINQIIEHICFWELIQMNEISVALRMGPLPQIPQNPDSIFIDADPKRINKNITTDYTKPFTYSVPLGNNEGKNNIIWYTKMRDESIEYLKSTNDNLRLYRVNFGPNIHQHYMMFFRHSFRHLGQIREVKKHPKYPK
jgi:hypothetical protein